MTDLPQALRNELAADFTLWTTSVVRHTQADDGTEKLLLALADGGQIECVLLRDEVRRTICISTQVGCGMGCVFCASGLDGVERNLTTGEIVEQMLRLQRLLAPDERLSHIVVMGMGEPLANLDNLLPALEEAGREDGLGISARRITISTVGLPKPMRRLADAGARYRLAVSLHAPNDELRRQIVPVSEKISLAEILAEADHYFDLSGRQLTFEYVLLAGINDSPEHAHELARLLGRRTALVNVIPFNPVAGLPYRTPSTSRPTNVPPHPRRPRPRGPLPPQERRRDRRRLRPAPPANATWRDFKLSRRSLLANGYRFSTMRIFSTPIDWIGASLITLLATCISRVAQLAEVRFAQFFGGRLANRDQRFVTQFAASRL